MKFTRIRTEVRQETVEVEAIEFIQFLTIHFDLIEAEFMVPSRIEPECVS